MGSMSIRGIPDDVHRAIKARAKRNGRSAEAEVRAALARAYRPPQGHKGLGTQIQEAFLELELPDGVFDHVRDTSDPPTFE